MRTVHKLVYLMGVWVLLLMTLPPTAAQAQTDDATVRVGEVQSLYAAERLPFYTDDGTWDVEEGDGVVRAVAAGAYRLRVEPEDTLAWSSTQLAAADFYLEAATLHVAGPVKRIRRALPLSG